MKVARTTYRLVYYHESYLIVVCFLYPRDGSEVVVKVFAKNDPSLQLKTYEKRLHGT